MKDYTLTGGTPSKPFPEEANFTVSSATSDVLGPGGIYTPTLDPGNDPNHFGQVKYARREGAISIYKDVTRNSANDNEASKKAESSTLYECEDGSEESQGI
jgi:hypothetical protein